MFSGFGGKRRGGRGRGRGGGRVTTGSEWWGSDVG